MIRALQKCNFTAALKVFLGPFFNKRIFEMFRPISLFFMLMIGLTLGCGDSSKARKTLEEVAVKGSVTVKNKPVADGEIYFIVSGYAPNIIAIQNGEYAGTAKVGSNRVEIRSWKDGPPLSTDPTNKPTKINTIPQEFNDASKLTAEVASKAENTFSFKIP
jgi:hypothetical protein